MASNLIELFHHTVGDVLVKQGSALLGESSENTSTAIRAIVPSLLAAIGQKSATNDGASEVLRFIRDNNLNGNILGNVSNLLTGNIETEKLMYSGAVLLRYLLNDKISPVVDLISAPSGLKTSSATSLLKISAPLLMGMLGGQIQEKGLDAQGLKSLMSGQKDFIREYIPKGMEEVLGINLKGTSAQPGTTSGSSGSSGFSKLLPWVVLLITALGLYYFVQKGCKTEVPAEPTAVVSQDTIVPAAKDSADPFKSVTLPNGVVIKALPGTFMDKLTAFLAGPETAETCFAFDRVKFEDGSFKIATGSERQLNQLVSIMNAYPDLKISIEGHTDEEGDNSKNKNLSKERARVIKEWLTGQGISAGRMDVKGWGEEKPIASNESSSGREKNRRIEVCAIKK